MSAYINEFDLLFKGLIPNPVAADSNKKTTLEDTISTYRKTIEAFQDTVQYFKNYEKRISNAYQRPTRQIIHQLTGSQNKYSRKCQEKQTLNMKITDLENQIQALLAPTCIFNKYSKNPF